jgi:hypothetical protein
MKRAISEHNFASGSDGRVDQDHVDTKVSCPQCTGCALCGGHQMVTVEERAAYNEMIQGRDICPRCAQHGPSRICPLCEGRDRVPPAVRVIWEVQHGRRPPRIKP